MKEEGGRNSGDQTMTEGGKIDGDQITGHRIAGTRLLRIGEGDPTDCMRQRKETQGLKGLVALL